MSESRWIWWYESVSGPFSVDKLYRMAIDKEISYKTLFWSEKQQLWKPLSGLLFDFDPETSRLDQMAKAGIKQIRILASGEQDCRACEALADKIFPIDSPPMLPPEKCHCVPWCRLVLVAVNDN